MISGFSTPGEPLFMDLHIPKSFERIRKLWTHLCNTLLCKYGKSRMLKILQSLCTILKLWNLKFEKLKIENLNFEHLGNWKWEAWIVDSG